MGSVFSAAEIIKLGIEIEKNGKEFYSRAIQTAVSAPAAKIFRALYDEELHHVDVFMKMLVVSGGYEPSDEDAGEYGSYLRALSREHVFSHSDGKLMASQIVSDTQAVELAMGFEKESILFYEKMKRYVPATEHGTVDKIIAQEQEHLKKLAELHKTLTSQPQNEAK